MVGNDLKKACFSQMRHIHLALQPAHFMIFLQIHLSVDLTPVGKIRKNQP